MQTAAARYPGPAEAFAPERLITSLRGYLPQRMVPDPAGYFVLYVDRARGLLSLEHYRQDGMLDSIIEGREAAALYTPAIEKGLVSRLDHAAYLGCELARAERALVAGTPYVQDGVPETAAVPEEPPCGCDSTCWDVVPR